MCEGGAAGGGPATLGPEQLDDLARLLVENVTPGNVTWLAQSVLGREASLEDAANDVADAAVYARRIVGILSEAGRIAEAVTVLRREAHRNSRLALGLNHVLQGQRLDDPALQKFVNDYEPFLGTAAFQDCLATMQRTVCAIALGKPHNEIVGSGFLVGPDLVMTNFHVLEQFLDVQPDGSIVQNGPGDQIFCFFDYLCEPPPAVPPDRVKHAPVVATAAERWLRHARRKLDKDGSDTAPAHVDKELDYAVIQLADAIGARPARLSGGALRGWLTLPGVIDVLNTRRVMVFQHPGRMHQQFDIGEFVELDPSGTRVRYRVSAAKGASGGAAVDSAAQLFALHNAEVRAGNPAARLNQGVRIDLITKDLADAAPATLAEKPPDGGVVTFWSLSETPGDPRPIIGRRTFREYVVGMQAPGGPRVMIVTGPPNSGVQFSIKILRRTLGSETPVVIFGAPELSTLGPKEFLRALVQGLGVLGLAGHPIPDAPSTESLSRWLSGDLPRWLLGRLAAHAERDAARFPAWVVVNTVVPQNQRLLWAEGLVDCIAGLVGVNVEPGQISVELPYLRWLFLGAVPDGLPLSGVDRHAETLGAAAGLKQDVQDCLDLAWRSLGKRVAPLDAVARSAIAAAALRNPPGDKPLLKALAEFLATMVTDAMAQVEAPP
jgi:hypothetical protein